MDKEALRKQLYEEIHSQFEAKLREARRQKSQLEDEMEVSSEKWRNERRRLNSEIDRLETKLGEAREARRKAPGSKPGKPADTPDFSKLQTAAEEKLNKAAREFEADRAKLQAEISRLQRGIAELIEKSNNPLRATQIEKDKVETKVEEALRAKRSAEDALLAAKTEWDEEKLKLVSELVHLRRSPGQAKALKARQDEESLEQLEKKFQETMRSRDGLEGDLGKARQDISRLKQSHSAAVDDLSVRLEKTQRELVGLEKQLRETSSAREKLERELERSREATASLKSSLTETQSRFKEELEEARSEVKLTARRVEETRTVAGKERTGLEKQLRDALSAQEKLERELEKARQVPVAMKESQAAEIARLKGDLEAARAAAGKERTSLERQLRDATSAQEKSQRELDRARQIPVGAVAAKDGQSAEVSHLREELEAARTEARVAAGRVEAVRTASSKERDSLEKQIRDASSAQQKLERELDKLRQAPVTLKESQTAELQRIKQELEAARAEAKQAASRADLARTAAAKERAGLEKQLRDASGAQQKLERELDKTKHSPVPTKGLSQEMSGIKDLEAARTEARIATAASKEHAATIARLNKELAEAREAIQKLEGRLGQNKEPVSSEIVDQLRRQYDDRMQEMIQQKSALSEQLRGATSLLEAERVKLGAGQGSSPTVNASGLGTETIDAEVARIQEMIAGIARIISNPETELSTVIRKNVERAELDAYLRGILFSLGRGKGF